MRVLVVGGTGQVGLALCADAPNQAQIFAPSSAELDLRRRETVDSTCGAFSPELVINAAAYTQVDAAEDDAEAAMQVNGAGPGFLAAACATLGCPLIHLSTDYVFDGSLQRPYREDDEPAPLNVYGRSKLAGEQALRAALRDHLILRVSWVFSATGANFVKTMLKLADRDELRVVADQHGTPCAAASIAAAIWRIAERLLASPCFGTYHFATTPATSWHEFAATIFQIRRELDAGAQTPNMLAATTEEWVTRARRPRKSVLDAAKLASDYGIAPPDWRSDLRAVLRELGPVNAV